MTPYPRINKYLVTVGLAESRRKADMLIKKGRVMVNGSAQVDLSYRVVGDDVVEVAGHVGKSRSDIYIAFNKPRGLVCSHAKQANNSTIFDVLPKSFASLKIAGRLDKDSQGLVILSSDGDFIQSLAHPSNEKSKTYIVTTNKKVTEQNLSALNAGIKLDDGISKLRATLINPTSVRVIMTEGKNRQIRRSFEATGLDVIKLERVKIGKYSNPRLGPEKFVFIGPEDIL